MLKNLLVLLVLFSTQLFADDTLVNAYQNYLNNKPLTSDQRSAFQGLIKDYYSGNEEKSLRAQETLMAALKQAERFQQDPYLENRFTKAYFGLVAVEKTFDMFEGYVMPFVETLSINDFIPSISFEDIPFLPHPEMGIQINPAYIAKEAEISLDLLEATLKVAIRLAIDSEVDKIKNTPGTALLPSDVTPDILRNFLKSVDLFIIGEISGDEKLKKMIQTEIATNFIKLSRSLAGLKKTPSGVTTVFQWENTIQRWLCLYYSDQVIGSFVNSLEYIKDVAIETTPDRKLKKELVQTLTTLNEFKAAKSQLKSLPKSGLLTDVVSLGIKGVTKFTNVDLALSSVELLNYYAERVAKNNPNSNAAKFASQVLNLTTNVTSKTAETSIGSVLFLTAAVDKGILGSVSAAKEFFNNSSYLDEIGKNISLGSFHLVKVCNIITEKTKTPLVKLFKKEE